MTRLPILRPADLSPEQRALYDAVNSGPRGPAHVLADGSMEGPFNAWLHHPAVGGPLQRVGAALRFEGVLPPAARELAILTVAAAHRAEFEWHAHAPIAAALGVDPARIEEVRRGVRPELADAVEQEAVEASRALLERGDLDDAEYERALRVLGAPGLVELTTLVGYYATLALQMHVFRVSPPDGVAPVFATEEG